MKEHLYRLAKPAISQANINAQKLGQIIIPVPELSEQCQIVAYLDRLQAKVQELRHLQEETQKEIEVVTASVLDKAFRGEF